MRRIPLFAILTAGLLITGSIHGDIPQTMSYQGLLTDASGQPAPDGTYDLTFKIYDVSSGGIHLWVETRSVWITGGRTEKIADGAVTLPKINSSGASSGQAIMYNGSGVTWGDPPGSGGVGLELPYDGVATTGGSAFSIKNAGNAIAAYSHNSSALCGETQNNVNGAVAIYGVASTPSQDSISFAIFAENDGTA